MPKNRLRVLLSQQHRPLGDQMTALDFQLRMRTLDLKLSLMEQCLGREGDRGTDRVVADIHNVDVFA